MKGRSKKLPAVKIYDVELRVTFRVRESGFVPSKDVVEALRGLPATYASMGAGGYGVGIARKPVLKYTVKAAIHRGRNKRVL